MNSKENIAGICNLVQRSWSRNKQRERVGNDTGSGESGMKSSTVYETLQSMLRGSAFILSDIENY